jgi:hypothetical protein
MKKVASTETMASQGRQVQVISDQRLLYSTAVQL